MVWLDNAKIIAVFAVVLLHVAAGVVVGSDIGTNVWWVGNIYDSLARWCVPVFIMASGAVLLDPQKTESIKDFYIKRLSKICIPLVFWVIFFSLLAMLEGKISAKPLAAMDAIKRIALGKPHYHMWFLYMIISLYAFTPFFRKMVAKASREELILLIVITFVLAAINTLGNHYYADESKIFTNWFLPCIPFFFLGYWVKTDTCERSKVVLWSVFVASFLLTATGCYIIASRLNLEAGLYFYNYLSVTVIPMSISAFWLLKLWVRPVFSAAVTKKLAFLTFGIYLIHPFFLTLFELAGYSPMSFYPEISVPGFSAFIFLLSLCSAWLINKTPYLSRVI